jgi:hypothetical protein
MSTVRQLKEALKEYADDTPLLWQFYTSEHAAIPEQYFEDVAEVLMNEAMFLEDHHAFISQWLESALDRIREEGGYN